MADKVLVRCSCGKKYRVPPEKLNKSLRCRGCGEVFVASPADADAPPPPAPDGREDAAAGERVERVGREERHDAPVEAPLEGEEREELPVEERGDPAPAPRRRREPDIFPPHASVRPRPAAEADPPPPVDPMSLMGGMTGRGFSGTLVIALVAHAGLIALTSFGFVKLCIEHGTLDPRATIREIREEQEAKEKQKRIEAALEKRRAEQAKAEEAAKAAKKRAPDDAAPKPGDEGANKSPVEKRVEETSDERPAEPTMNLDDRLDLE